MAPGLAVDVGASGLSDRWAPHRHPPARQPLGWLLLLFGLSLGANGFLRVYAEYTLLYRPGALPGGLAIAWVSTWIWAFIYPILPFVLLLFPDGRLPSRRWRPFAWIIGLVNGLLVLMVPFRAGWSTSPRSPTQSVSRRLPQQSLNISRSPRS